MQAAQKRSPSDPNEADSSESSTPRKIIDVACWPCRRRKAKRRTTGVRALRTARSVTHTSSYLSSTSLTTTAEVECSYEHEEGMTRQGSLRLKLDTATSRAENLECLFSQLRSRPDNEAALLLAVIRLGADLDQLVERLKAESDLEWLTHFSATQGIDVTGLQKS
ncbi:hypothetical protein PRZ48_006637 [Zasmidium cellare]|uniref:Uncharacterized protein n=1 Tax=Zasmidium cellare TaxID=395010 RepID=A0ABR0ENM5_ZASCE|nr:hypothetical protein PRZ48_006637 [Zasmidium cellare]